MTQPHHHAGSPCRVCGFQNPPQAAGGTAKCECCGVRIGLDDQRAADIAMWRAKFISNGGKWQKKQTTEPLHSARE